jgi:hypothetical protein
MDVTRRLLAEFGAHLEPEVIAAVVDGCRQDLAGTPTGPLPELLERLARQRLSDGQLGPLSGPSHPTSAIDAAS